VGTILGSLVTGFILVPQLGTKFSLLLAAMLAALTALYLAGLSAGEAHRRLAPWLAAAVLLPVAALAMPDPLLQIMQRRLAANNQGSLVYYSEDRAGAVGVVFSGRNRGLYINSVAVAGNGDAGRLMVHLPLLLQEAPREMFLVGLGATTSLRSGVLHGVKVTAAELLASVREAGPIFLREWRELAAAGKFSVRLNDGRNELLRSGDRYDLIVVDVTPPIFSSGAVNVYSRDFFRLARTRLTKTGMMSLWVPQPCFESDLHMILRSMREVFPQVNVWHFPGLPGFLAVGSEEQPLPDPKILAARIKRSGAAGELPYLTPDFISRMLFMDDARVSAAAAQYPPVTDDKPYTEFPLARFLAFSPKW
jgi:spermidine synthase